MLTPLLLASLLASSLAHADSFLTSVELVRSPTTPLPTAGSCQVELQALGANVNAFDHAMVLGACHGYDSNPALVDTVRRWAATTSNPLKDLDLGYVLVYEGTYQEGGKGKKGASGGATSVRAALKARPADARAWLVAALVLAQQELFIDGGDWEKPNANSKEVVSMVRHAATLNRSAPTSDFQPSLDAAVDYMVMYGVYAELASERSQPELPPTTGHGD